MTHITRRFDATRRTRKLAATLLLGALAGCSLTPVYERPAVTMPSAWDAASGDAAVAVDPAWWRRFGSVELDTLMDTAMSANHDLGAAVERVEQARARVDGARGGLLPSVAAGGSESLSVTRGGGQSARSQNAGASLSLSWETDLFGANQAALSATEARLAASRYDREAVALALQSGVATAYFQALAYQDRIAITERNLAAANQLLRLVQVRFDNGGASELELAQQRTVALGIEASLPTLRQGLRETLHALAVLLGRAPQGFAIEGTSLAELTLPAVDPAQPALLLERRPDIRVAEAGLVAANADIGAARAALYPSLTLAASSGVSGLLSGGTTTVATLAASLAQTLFDGGQLESQVAYSEAAKRELVESYAQTVLTALKEVEDSLWSIDHNETRAALLAQTAHEARESYRLAKVRYGNGAEDLLSLLDSQRSQLSAEDSLVQAEFARYEATTTLFKALGGGWVADPSMTSLPSSRATATLIAAGRSDVTP